MEREADHPTPHSEQTGDEAETRSRDLGEQPRERRLSPGDAHEEPNPGATGPEEESPAG